MDNWRKMSQNEWLQVIIHSEQEGEWWMEKLCLWFATSFTRSVIKMMNGWNYLLMSSIFNSLNPFLGGRDSSTCWVPGSNWPHQQMAIAFLPTFAWVQVGSPLGNSICTKIISGIQPALIQDPTCWTQPAASFCLKALVLHRSHHFLEPNECRNFY